MSSSPISGPSSAEQTLPTFRQVNPTTHRRVKRKTISGTHIGQNGAAFYDSDAGPSSSVASSFVPLATRRESASLYRRQSGTFSIRDESGSYFTPPPGGSQSKGKERERTRPLPRPPSLTQSASASASARSTTSSPIGGASPIHTIATVNNHIAGNWKMRASWGRMQLRDQNMTSPRNSIDTPTTAHHVVDAFKMRAQWRSRLTQLPIPTTPGGTPRELPTSRIPTVPPLPSTPEMIREEDNYALHDLPSKSQPSERGPRRSSTDTPVSRGRRQDSKSPGSPEAALASPTSSTTNSEQFITITSSSPHTSVSPSPGPSMINGHGFGLDLMDFPSPPVELPVTPAGGTFDLEAFKRRSLRGRGSGMIAGSEATRERNTSEPSRKIQAFENPPRTDIIPTFSPDNSSGSGYHFATVADGAEEEEEEETVRRSQSLDFKRMKEAQRRRSRENSKKRRSVTSSLHSDGDTPTKKRRSQPERPPIPLPPMSSAKTKRRRDPPSPLILSSSIMGSRQAENENEPETTPKLEELKSRNASQSTLTATVNEPSVVTVVRKRTFVRPAEIAEYRTVPATVDPTSLPIVEPEKDDDMAGAEFMLSSAQAHARMQAELLAKVSRHPPVIKLNQTTPKASHAVFSQSTLSLHSSAVVDDHSDGWTTPTEGFRTPLAHSSTNLPLPNRPFADVPMSVYDSGSAAGSRTNIGRSGLFTAEPTSSSVYEFATPVGSMVHVRESTATIDSETSYEPDSSRDSHATTADTSRDSAASYDSTPGATPDNSSTDPETEAEHKDQFDDEGYNNPWLRDRPLPDVPLPLSSASSIYTSESGTSASVNTEDSNRRTLLSRFDSSRSRISLGLKSVTKSIRSTRAPKPPKIVVPDLPKNGRWFGRKNKKHHASDDFGSVFSEPNTHSNAFDENYAKALVPFMSTTSLIPASSPPRTPAIEQTPSSLEQPPSSLAIVTSSSALVLARPPPRRSSLAASRKKPPRTTLLRSTFRSALPPSTPHLAITDVGYNEAFTEHGQLTEYQLMEASKLEVIAETGHRVPFGALWMNQRTIVIFIRHFWCPICQDYMYSISKEVDPIMLGRANVQLVIISNGSYKMIKAYRKIFRTPFTLFTDPTLNLYHALGMILSTTDGGPENEKGDYVKHGLVSGVAMVVSNAAKARMPIWANGGDIEQLGGEFVFGPGVKISFVHRMKNTRSHAPIADVCLAAGVDIRTTRALNGGRSSFVAIFQNNDEARWREAQRRSLERLHQEQEQGYDEQEDVDEIGGDMGVGNVRQRAEAVERSVKTVRQTINKLDEIVAEEKARIRTKRDFSQPLHSSREDTGSLASISADASDGDMNAVFTNLDARTSRPSFIRRKKNVNPPTSFTTKPHLKGKDNDISDTDGDNDDENLRSRTSSVNSARSKQALYREVKHPFPELNSDTDPEASRPTNEANEPVSASDDAAMVLRLVDGIWKQVPAGVSDNDTSDDDASQDSDSSNDEDQTEKPRF